MNFTKILDDIRRGRLELDRDGSDDRGFRPIQQRNGRQYQESLREAARLIKRATDGDDYARLMLRDAMRGRLREAMGISDFPVLFGDLISRAVLANYAEAPYTWNLVARPAEINNFGTAKRIAPDYDAALERVEMGAQYPEGKVSGTEYTYKVEKYGKRMPFFWELMINDDLNVLKDTPAAFGRAARRAEQRFVTGLFAGNTDFFKSANGNTVVPIGPYTGTNPPLDISSFAQALTILGSNVDDQGEPITIDQVTLVVPPALEVTAQNILNASFIFANAEGGTILSDTGAMTSGMRLQVNNWARNRTRLAVDPYLPILDTQTGHSGWYVFASPDNGRPAIEFGRLRGYAGPQLFMKSPNAIAISETGAIGSEVNPMEGDFDIDAIHYKVRHVFGGGLIDPKMAVFSDGTGS